MILIRFQGREEFNDIPDTVATETATGVNSKLLQSIFKYFVLEYHIFIDGILDIFRGGLVVKASDPVMLT